MRIAHHEHPLRALLGAFLLLGSLLWGTESAAKTVYVGKTGTDANNCTTQATNIATPKLTIQAGVDCLAPGDTLYIRAGTYVEPVVYRLVATAGQPVTVAGYPGDARPVQKTTTSGNGVAFTVVGSVVSDAYLTIKDFEIDNTDFGGESTCLGVYMRHVTVENMICRNSGRNAFFFGGPPTAGLNSDFAIARNNQAIACGKFQPSYEIDTKGLGFYTITANGLFENNLIDGCRAGGFEINYDGNQNSVYRNNIIRNAGCASPWGCISRTWDQGTTRPTAPRGVVIGGAGVNGPNGPTNNKVYNNVMYNLQGTDGESRCLGLWGGGVGGGTNLFANNTCYNTERPMITLCSTGNFINIQNNIFAGTLYPSNNCGTITGTQTPNLTNPTVASTFVNAGAGDFHLITTSPARNQGVNLSSVFTTDFEGGIRPGGSTVWDLGADQFGVGGGLPAPTNMRLLSITPSP